MSAPRPLVIAVPYPHIWNASIWTLRWEFLCYFAVLALGLMGLLVRHWLIAATFLLFTVAQVAVALGGVENYWITSPVRFGLMFAAGILIYVLRGNLPVSRRLIAVAGAVVVVSIAVMPEYRMTGACFYAYLIVQQCLAGTAAVAWHPLVFAAAAFGLAFPFALASCFAMERPANRLRRIPILSGTVPRGREMVARV